MTGLLLALWLSGGMALWCAWPLSSAPAGEWARTHRLSSALLSWLWPVWAGLILIAVAAAAVVVWLLDPWMEGSGERGK